MLPTYHLKLTFSRAKKAIDALKMRRDVLKKAIYTPKKATVDSQFALDES